MSQEKPMRPLEQAHRDAIRLPIANIAEMLQEALGQRLAAYAVGLRDPKAVGRYAREEQEPRQETEGRLRDLYRVTRILLARETSRTVRAWMIGANPLLDDRAPVELLHRRSVAPVMRTAEAESPPDSSEEGIQPVIRAAEAFAAAG